MEYESRKLRTDIPVFDNHCHVCFPEPIEDTQRGFERYIQELGISALGILSAPRVRHTGMDVDILENLKVLYLKERLSVPVYAYAGFIDYSDDGEDYVAFAKSALAMGFDGFKSLEQHPAERKKFGRPLCLPSFDSFFDYLGEVGAPIVCHIGDPRFNWSLDTASESAKMLGRVYDDHFLTLDELYDEMGQVFRKHPNVKFILAHFYFRTDDHDGLVELMECYPNICLDLTPGTEMYLNFSKNPELWRNFFLRYSQRIIMGSDLYGAGYGSNRHRLVRAFLETGEPFAVNDKADVVTPLKLPDKVLSDICFQNARRLLAHDPNPVDREKAFAACKYIAQHRYHELNEIGKENLRTFMKFWG